MNQKQYQHEYYLRNKERIKERDRKRFAQKPLVYTDEQREKRRERAAEWRKKHPAAFKEYYWGHREQMLQKSREWKNNNPDKVKAKQKRWAKKNPQKVKASNRKQYERNRQQRIAYAKKYFQEHKEQAAKTARERFVPAKVKKLADKIASDWQPPSEGNYRD